MELLGKSKNELRDFCVALGEPAYRGGQLYHALYAQRKFSVREITNLPAAFRERLAAETTITLPTVRQTYASQDGSIRYLFGLSDSGADAKRKSGPVSVEAVFMPSTGRQTICLSTQAGCAADCPFRLTPQLGLIRNPTPPEILAPVLPPPQQHKSHIPQPTNPRLMGHGQPRLN